MAKFRKHYYDGHGALCGTPVAAYESHIWGTRDSGKVTCLKCLRRMREEFAELKELHKTVKVGSDD